MMRVLGLGFPALLLIFMWMPLSSASLTMYLGNGTVLYFETAQLFYEGMSIPFQTYSGEMISELNNDTSSFAGKIVYWKTGTPPNSKIRKYMSLGVIGIVMGSGWITPGRHMYLTDGSGSADFTIPISQLRKPDWPYVGKVSEKHYVSRGPPKYLTRCGNYTHSFFLLFLAQALSVQPIINVTITSEEGNTWYNINSSGAMIAGQVILSAIILSAIVLAIYKLHFYKLAQGLMWNIAQVTLWLEIIGNTLRLLYSAVDPLNSRMVFKYWAEIYIERINIPFSLGASLLIVFFWHEAMEKTVGNPHPFLHKLKIPFYILIALLLGLHFAVSSVATTQWTSFPMDSLIRGLYVGIAGVLLLFYLYTGIRVFKRLKRSQQTSKRKRSLTKTSKMMFVSASGLALFVIIEIIYLSSELPTAYQYTVFFYLNHFALTYTSIAQIMAFQPEVLSKSTGTSSLTKTKSNITGDSHNTRGAESDKVSSKI